MWNIVDQGSVLPKKGRYIVVQPGQHHGTDGWHASDNPNSPVIAQLFFDIDGGAYWACNGGIGEDILIGDKWFYVPD